MPATRLRGLSKRAGLTVLAGLLAVTIALLIAAANYAAPHKAKTAGKTTGDAVTYHRIIKRMKAGEPYYQAAHEELLAGDYGTRSVFNWRTPLYAQLLSLLPSWRDARYVMMALAIAVALFVGLPILNSAGVLVGLPLALAFVVSLANATSTNAAMFSELPCGLLILLSVGFYMRGQHRGAILVAVLALFLRELAAPFVLVLLADSVRRRRWREVRLMALLLCAYCAYYAWHAYMVSQTIGPMDKSYAQGWVQFGGLEFVLATARSNGIFWLFAMQVTAIWLPLSLLGLAAWPARAGLIALAAVGLYLAAFMVVGKPVNVYWGLVYTPMLAIGLGWAPAALLDLWRVLTGAKSGSLMAPAHQPNSE